MPGPLATSPISEDLLTDGFSGPCARSTDTRKCICVLPQFFQQAFRFQVRISF